MMMSKAVRFVACAAATSVFAAGCAASPPESGASVGDDDALETQATIYNTNSAGTWSATAGTPQVLNGTTSRATASFTGPSGYTRKMGVCKLQIYTSQLGFPYYTTCSSTVDCGTSPTNLPLGGARYCLQIDGTGSKYCMWRVGSQTADCAGSPAQGGAAVAPGTYSSPYTTQSYPVVSDACFEGCAASDPSVSSAATGDTCSAVSCNGAQEAYFPNTSEVSRFCSHGSCSSGGGGCNYLGMSLIKTCWNNSGPSNYCSSQSYVGPYTVSSSCS